MGLTNRFPPLSEVTDEYVSTEQAAYYMGKHPQTLRTWACQDDGPLHAVRDNGRLAWPVDELRKLCPGLPKRNLHAEITHLRMLCAVAYQLAGLVGAPVRWLDAFSDAASGTIGDKFKDSPLDLLPISRDQLTKGSKD